MAKTIRQIAEELGVSKTAVNKQIANLGLRSSLRKNGNQFAIDNQQEALIKQAFLEKSQTEIENQTQTKSQTENHEVFDLVSVLQTTIDTLQGQLGAKDQQIEQLHTELQKEREHNREKDRQLLEALSKLADSQAALAAGHAAEKQKELADKLIEGQQLISGDAAEEPEEAPTEERRGWLHRLFSR